MTRPAAAPRQSERLPVVPLTALALAVFVSVTTEFLPTAVLTPMARDLRVDPAALPLLVTVFAVAVVALTPLLVRLTLRVERRRLLLIALAVMAVANLGAAFASGMPLIVVARVLAGAAHGLFWAVTGSYTAQLVPGNRLAQAVAITGGGVSAAFVLGVPAGAALADAFGWRMPFVVVAAALVIAVILLRLVLPEVPADSRRSTERKQRDRDPSTVRVLALCGIVILVMGSQYALFSLISPYLLDVVGLSPGALPGVLVVYGGVGIAGLVGAGWAGSRWPTATPVVLVAGLAAGVFLLAVAEGNPVLGVAGVAVWGIAFGGVPAILQFSVLAAASTDLRPRASAWLTSTFNAAIGGGALVGAGLTSTVGLEFLAWAALPGLALAVGGLVVIGRRA
ncbi:putative MFS family arabinose efflux permease [Mycetocola sp. CAN_C7]|uniref:MFS transporter n=1 Tax=Mycetocola sp. CAN_C7 TaxID=2787724 RepID=UPI0018C9CDBE